MVGSSVSNALDARFFFDTNLFPNLEALGFCVDKSYGELDGNSIGGLAYSEDGIFSFRLLNNFGEPCNETELAFVRNILQDGMKKFHRYNNKKFSIPEPDEDTIQYDVEKSLLLLTDSERCLYANFSKVPDPWHSKAEIEEEASAIAEIEVEGARTSVFKEHHDYISALACELGLRSISSKPVDNFQGIMRLSIAPLLKPSDFSWDVRHPMGFSEGIEAVNDASYDKAREAAVPRRDISF